MNVALHLLSGRDCAESQSQISTKEDFVFIAKEQQRARVPWPNAAKCYSLSLRERAGVRGKCAQYSHASQFLRFGSPVFTEPRQVANIALRCFRPRTSGRKGGRNPAH